jgi:DNA-directed RNA polymerase subunit E'
MYMYVKRENVVRIPPHRLGEDIETVVEELAREAFEGKIDNSKALTVLITNVACTSEGRIVHGDGAVYQPVVYEALVFKPVLQEIITGIVVDVLKFGAFIRFGPFDGLLHISQIMDERVEVDEANKRFVGKDSKRDLRLDDLVRARVVSISINERSPRESRIGLTMRQVGLGKIDWLKARDKEEKEKKEGKKEKEKEKPAKKKKK